MKHSVTEHTLASGAQGLIINLPTSDVVSIIVRFNSGFQFADQSKYEIPHVMEHLLATASAKYPGPNQFHIEAVKNGAYANANTSDDANGYVFECAVFELDRILDLLEEQLVRPLFSGGALAAELGNVREELSRNTTQHQAVCMKLLSERVFPGQSLNFDTRMGQLADIKLDDLANHYHRTHTAANARFYVAGHFEDGGQAVVARLEQLFDQLPAGKRLTLNPAIGLAQPAPIVTPRDINQLYYQMSFFFGQLDEHQQRALMMLRLVLVGGMASRIFGAARRRGLAYGVGASFDAVRGNSQFGFVGTVTPENGAELFKLMAAELSAMGQGELEPAELEAAANLGIGSTQRSHQTAGDMLGWYLRPYDIESKIRDFDTEMAALRRVTVADIAEIAQKVVGAQRAGMSLLGEVDSDQAAKYWQIFEPIWK